MIMTDKVLAGVVTAVAITPICALCILGPAILGSMIGGAFGWVMDLGPAVTTGSAIIAAILVYGFFSRKKRAPGRDDGALGSPDREPAGTGSP